MPVPKKLRRDIRQNIELFLLVLPVIVFYFIFHYIPIYGASIAFKDYSVGLGIADSPWVGFKWFMQFFRSFYFFRLVRNTFLLNFFYLVFGFPVPILFALLLNEIRSKGYKRVIQTVSYLPHFISTVIIVGILLDILDPGGIINQAIGLVGIGRISFLSDPAWFRPVYVGSTIWVEFGWSSIVYLATLANADQNLYEAAEIDGANRFQQAIYVTIPLLIPVITILFILAIGRTLAVDFEKVLLLQNPATYETSDVIQTYVYRRGILGADFSFGKAVGLFGSVINFTLLFIANRLSKYLGTVSLW